MDNEQFEKDRRNRWAQTRVIVEELRGIRRAVEVLAISTFLLLVLAFMAVLGYFTTGGG